MTTTMLRQGLLTAASPLVAVPHVGEYLERRLRRAMGRARPLTVGDVWIDLGPPMSPARATRTLRQALQNRRSNQCVRPAPAADDSYHAGDVNVLGYRSCSALLAYVGQQVTPMSRRSPGAKRCGCHATADDCRRDRACAVAGSACVPHAHNAGGFVGAPPHPDQSVRATTALERRRVRDRARTRSPGTDVDPIADVQAGHPQRMRYTVRGARMWRTPGRKVRVPVR